MGAFVGRSRTVGTGSELMLFEMILVGGAALLVAGSAGRTAGTGRPDRDPDCGRGATPRHVAGVRDSPGHGGCRVGSIERPTAPPVRVAPGSPLGRGRDPAPDRHSAPVSLAGDAASRAGRPLRDRTALAGGGRFEPAGAVRHRARRDPPLSGEDLVPGPSRHDRSAGAVRRTPRVRRRRDAPVLVLPRRPDPDQRDPRGPARHR